MTDATGLSATAVRGAGAKRNDRRARLPAVAAGAVLALTGSLLWTPPTLLLWNVSASAPRGLYLVLPRGRVHRGEMVVARVPGTIRDLAARRRYLPANVPLLKQVAAVPGDHLCAEGARIAVNGRVVSYRQRTDPSFRPMPWWNGCRLLSRNEHLLLMLDRRSFDGRYFGPVGAGDLIGRAVLLWRR